MLEKLASYILIGGDQEFSTLALGWLMASVKSSFS